MASRTYKIYSNALGSTFAAAWAQIAERSRIVAIDLCATLLAAAASDSGMIWEVSLAANLQVTTNDALSCLGYIAINSDFDTAVARSPMYANKTLSGLSMPVLPGDRVYINSLLLSGAPSVAHCMAVVYVV